MTNQIDPVQGLVDYTKEVKPYHTKITEVLVDYIHTDLVGISVVDSMSFKLLIDANYNPNYCTNAGFGIGPYGDYYKLGQQPIHINVISINVIDGVFVVAGDFRIFANIGNTLNIESSSSGHNGAWFITNMDYDSVQHITGVTVTKTYDDGSTSIQLMNGIADGNIVSISSASYPITRVDTTNALFVIDGNHSSAFSVGNIINVNSSTGNDGNWEVTSVFYHLLDDTTVLGVVFNSITTPSNAGIGWDGVEWDTEDGVEWDAENYVVDGYVTAYGQSNFDLPETCPSVPPNMARATFVEELDFVLGDTVWFRDFISVEIIEPTGIVPWSGGVYGWGVAGYNTGWPSFIAMVENMSDFVGMSVQENMAVEDNVLIPNMGQYAFNDIGWDASELDADLGIEWDPAFAPDVALHAVQTAIVDSMRVEGNIAAGFDLPYFDVGVFD